MGTVAFILVNGRSRGQSVHDRVSTPCCVAPKPSDTNTLLVLPTEAMVCSAAIRLACVSYWPLYSVSICDPRLQECANGW